MLGNVGVKIGRISMRGQMTNHTPVSGVIHEPRRMTSDVQATSCSPCEFSKEGAIRSSFTMVCTQFAVWLGGGHNERYYIIQIEIFLSIS